MRISAPFSLLLATLGTFTFVRGLTPADPPTLEVLFVGFIHIEEIRTIDNGTFGTRVHATITGGNFSDPAGNVVGTILPTAEVGIVTSTGTFFPDAILPVVWTADNKYAHLHAKGVGDFGTSSLLYMHLETDSEQYSDLNSKFLLGNITFAGQAADSTVTIFGTK
ncbi:hypothetical protein C8Q80DRAFT_360709 [Daedaleopsis nitida]|nr:hypothetical protein C8Q80DRAFT_360709 [Daedaleopsis nitida]